MAKNRVTKNSTSQEKAQYLQDLLLKETKRLNVSVQPRVLFPGNKKPLSVKWAEKVFQRHGARNEIRFFDLNK